MDPPFGGRSAASRSTPLPHSAKVGGPAFKSLLKSCRTATIARREDPDRGVQGLLQGARRGARRERRADQEGLPRAGAQVPPRRQQGAGCCGPDERGQRGERGAVRPRTPRRLRRLGQRPAPGRGIHAAARLGCRLRVLRPRRPGGHGRRRLQRLLRRAVRTHGRRRTRRSPARWRRPCDARPGPPREDRARHRGRLPRRDAPGLAAQSAARRPGPGRAGRAHAGRAHPGRRAARDR